MTLPHGPSRSSAWPEPPRDWEASRATLHLWLQVIGKVRLACTPVLSHWWNVPLYITARGLSTLLIPHHAGRSFQIDLDLTEHELIISATDGGQRRHRLQPESVAAFYRTVMSLLEELGLPVEIWTMPVEIDDAIPFEHDTAHASYDAAQVHRFWRTLVESQRVLELFRSGFVGKTSLVHLFWGSLDLATSRFSGRTAPLHGGGAAHCAPRVMQEAYSREVWSSGYWPGPDGSGVYYAYAYLEPSRFGDTSIFPSEAHYDEEIGEFILPYKAVQRAPDPDNVLLQFLQSTYDAAADCADWDRSLLERPRDGTT
jgi:hypothetical protein